MAHSRWLLAVYYAIAAMCGVRATWHAASSGLDLLAVFALSIALGAWAITDARLRGRPIPWAVQPLLILFAAMGVPIYVVWSRRWRGLGWVVLHGVGWCAVALASAAAAGWFFFPASRAA